MTTLCNTPSARQLAVVTMLGMLAMLAACANLPAPLQEVADAERAVQEAVDADAATLAPADLEKAHRKLDAARSALQAQRHLQARQLAEQAVVDAELAQITARVEAAARATAEMRAQIGDPGRSPLRPAGS